MTIWDFLGIYKYVVMWSIWSVIIFGINWLPAVPIEIYRETRLNMPTCCILWLFLLITIPAYYFLKLIIWVAHVGRRNDKHW
jgi:hypothetical protein